MVGNRIEVVAAVIERGGKILVAQRPDDANLGGLWEFPGGKREPGETHEECLVREIREELGATVTVNEKITSTFHRYPDCAVLLSFYRAELVDDEPRPVCAKDIRWVTPDELACLDMPEADKPLVAMLRTSR